MDAPTPPHAAPAPRWQPIKAIDRRVLGVLAEKAKSTPDAYPLSLNALVGGCNQKSNRYPMMELEPEAVQDSIERLKQLGAVVEVQGSSRVARFRHQLYDWLGVEKVELSVMAELLLRGAQTEGELRQRAGRMDPIADLPALRTMLNSLAAKKLVISITPEGRGHVVSHALYEERELEKVKAEFNAQHLAAAAHDDNDDSPSISPRPAASASSSTPMHEIANLKQEIGALREQVAQLRREMEDLRTALT